MPPIIVAMAPVLQVARHVASGAALRAVAGEHCESMTAGLID
jgi:hypothetical protein